MLHGLMIRSIISNSKDNYFNNLSRNMIFFLIENFKLWRSVCYVKSNK